MATPAALKKDFMRLAGASRLAHSYLFFGEDSNNNLAFVRELANYLENGKWSLPISPPLDVMISGGGIDDMRAGISFLWQKPVKSSHKILVIPKAEALTLEAQNAVLKISEDGPSHSLILLLAKNIEVLLPTVQSRFQKVFISSSPGSGEMAVSEESEKMVDNFLEIDATKRKQAIKDLLALEDGQLLEDFVTGIIVSLRRDKIKNYLAIKEILHRWTLMQQYNTNKRLQLEAALSWI
ncbi:MAG: hypothetical protein Q8O87_04265 [bacterium]|nr:hypothetical protein [bacterium]